MADKRSQTHIGHHSLALNGTAPIHAKQHRKQPPHHINREHRYHSGTRSYHKKISHEVKTYDLSHNQHPQGESHPSANIVSARLHHKTNSHGHPHAASHQQQHATGQALAITKRLIHSNTSHHGNAGHHDPHHNS